VPKNLGQSILSVLFQFAIQPIRSYLLPEILPEILPEKYSSNLIGSLLTVNFAVNSACAPKIKTKKFLYQNKTLKFFMIWILKS